MEVKLTGTAEEIAALVLQLQGRREGSAREEAKGSEHPQMDSHRPQRAAGNRQSRYAEAPPAAGQSPDAKGPYSAEEIERAFFGRMTMHSASGKFTFSRCRKSEKLMGEMTSKDVSKTGLRIQP